MTAVLITCEHAGNVVPEEYKGRFKKYANLLKTHRGIDIGAFTVAQYLHKKFQAPFNYCKITRLLVDQNRSLHSKTLFFLPLKLPEKNYLLLQYYFPYRQKVQESIERLILEKKRVVHLSIHSFTPVFDDVTRNVDIGLLYDPKREREKSFCKSVRDAIDRTEYTVRYNAPYRGSSDGLTTAFRKKYSEKNYLGIEIELNQNLIGSVNRKLQQELFAALRSALW